MFCKCQDKSLIQGRYDNEKVKMEHSFDLKIFSKQNVGWNLLNHIVIQFFSFVAVILLKTEHSYHYNLRWDDLTMETNHYFVLANVY